jgi:hypothetical protein
MIVMTGPLDKALWWTSSKENRSGGDRRHLKWRYTWRIFLWNYGTTDGLDRRAIYTMVDRHDGRMISPSILVHVEGIWKEVFVIVMDWASIDGLSELAEDYLYGRTGQDVFSMEDSVRKSLAQGSQKVVGFLPQPGGRGRIEQGELRRGRSVRCMLKTIMLIFVLNFIYCNISWWCELWNYICDMLFFIFILCTCDMIYFLLQ